MVFEPNEHPYDLYTVVSLRLSILNVDERLYDFYFQSTGKSILVIMQNVYVLYGQQFAGSS